MIKIVAYIRPHMLEATKSAIASIGVNGLTVADARGRGRDEDRSAWNSGGVQLAALPIRSRLEVVIQDEYKDQVIQAILDNARTGEPGDGKIFVSKVVDAIRVRTGERGEAVV